MPRIVFFLICCLFSLVSAVAQTAPPGEVAVAGLPPVVPAPAVDVTLRDGESARDLRPLGRWVIAPSGQPDRALDALTAAHPPSTRWRSVQLNPGQSYWGWIQVQVEPPALAADWFIRIPNPAVDHLRLFWRVSSEQAWSAAQSGDRVAAHDAEVRSVTPVVRARAGSGRQEWLVEIANLQGGMNNAIELLPLRLLTVDLFHQSLLTGVLLCLSGGLLIAGLIRAARHPDTEHLVSCCFFASVLFGCLIQTGAGNFWIWGQWPAVNHWLRFAALPAIMVTWIGMNLLVLRLPQRAPRVTRALYFWLGLLVLTALSIPLLENLGNAARTVLRLSLYSSFLIVMAVTAWLIRLGHRDGALALAGQLVVFAAGLASAGYNQGWIQAGDWAWLGYPAGLVAGGWWLYHLHEYRVASDDVVTLRARELGTQDPLTGLPNQSAAAYSFDRMAVRAAFFGHRGVCARISLTNAQQMIDEGGNRLLNECLVRLSSRLRLSLRTIDLLARLDDGDFVVLLDGPQNQASARDAATRWVAAALRTPVGGVTPRIRVGMTTFDNREQNLQSALDAIEAKRSRIPGTRGDRSIFDTFQGDLGLRDSAPGR